VDEGAVGAGTGTSRSAGRGHRHFVADVRQGNDTWTVGVLVQSNYGGKLVINGVPVWKELTPRGERRGRSATSASKAEAPPADARRTAPA
jgi:D-aminopeptidase